MIFIDTEFNRTTHPFVNPVCAVLYELPAKKEHRFWTHNNKAAQNKLKDFILERKDQVFICYGGAAEGRFFLSLGLRPIDFKWIDLFIEYRYISNNNDEIAYGEQLVNGKVKMTRRPPPKWERTEEDSKTAFKQTHSLAEATFKLTKNIRDTDQKNAMRDLIISDPAQFSQDERQQILDYCADDTVFLPEIYNEITKIICELHGIPKLDAETKKEMLVRGEYSAAVAMMENWGYPIDVEKTKNFSEAVGPLLDEAQREINALFPDIKPFQFDRKTGKFVTKQDRLKDWLKSNVDINRWMVTDSFNKAKKKERIAKKEGLEHSPVDRAKYLSLSLDAWGKFFDFRHEYPKDNFAAQMVRYLKLRQNLNGFVPGGRGNFWDAVGPDGMVRCYLNPYGAATSRNQPGSTSFLFLKPAWMRALAQPPKGKAMGAFDYGSEEYLISALWAECQAMVESYGSGDVYLAFAKLAGIVPMTATKESHKKERDLCKAIVLAMSYLMTAKGLAEKLTVDTGTPFTEEQAQEYIDQFYEVFSELDEAQKRVVKEYDQDGYLRLPCGWRTWGDNDNFRATVNFGVQGFGGSILRRAIVTAIKDYGLEPRVPLHDAVYIMYDAYDLDKMDRLYKAMHEAFCYYFDDKKSAALIRLDGFTWSPDYPKITFSDKGKPTYPEIVTPGGLEISCGDFYLDERAVAEYRQFSKYFTRREELDL